MPAACGSRSHDLSAAYLRRHAGTPISRPRERSVNHPNRWMVFAPLWCELYLFRIENRTSKCSRWDLRRCGERGSVKSGRGVVTRSADIEEYGRVQLSDGAGAWRIGRRALAIAMAARRRRCADRRASKLGSSEYRDLAGGAEPLHGGMPEAHRPGGPQPGLRPRCPSLDSAARDHLLNGLRKAGLLL